MKVGVLGVQGAIEEHMHILSQLVGSGNVTRIRRKEELDEISALVIPGGESTAISRLMLKNQLFEKVRELGQEGMPILGTCAGLILLAKKGGAQVRKTKQKLCLLYTSPSPRD